MRKGNKGKGAEEMCDSEYRRSIEGNSVNFKVIIEGFSERRLGLGFMKPRI